MVTILPDIDFVDTDPEKISEEVIAAYEEFEGRELSKADPVRIFILAMAKVIALQNIRINDSAKQNLLHYSRDDVLDHKGYAWGKEVERLKASHATAVVRFHINKLVSESKIIKKGTLLTTANSEPIFQLANDMATGPDVEFVDGRVVCLESGVVGNGLKEGVLDRLITPLHFISRVENITVTEGGSEKEEDRNYRNRIHQAPESLSIAGPSGAYEFLARKASALVDDVDVTSPRPGCVDVRILLKNGELPGLEILEAVNSELSDKTKRPLTDLVEVKIPDVSLYDLDVTYYISESANDKSLIQKNIESAIEEYLLWQSSKIGRDINPSKLISDCVQAGAKRVEVLSPSFTVIHKSSVAQLREKVVKLGGVESD